MSYLDITTCSPSLYNAKLTCQKIIDEINLEHVDKATINLCEELLNIIVYQVGTNNNV